MNDAAGHGRVDIAEPFESLDRLGWAVIEALDPSDVGHCLRLIELVGVAPDDAGCGFTSSAGSCFAEYRASVHAELEPFVHEALGLPDVEDVRIEITWPGPLSGRGLSRSGVSSLRSADVECRVALHPVDEDNGVLWVLARGAPPIEPDDGKVPSGLVQRWARPVPLQAGQALVLGAGTQWFAEPNLSHQPWCRLAFRARREQIADLRAVRVPDLARLERRPPAPPAPPVRFCPRCGALERASQDPDRWAHHRQRECATCARRSAEPAPSRAALRRLLVTDRPGGAADAAPGIGMATAVSDPGGTGRTASTRQALIDPGLDARLAHDGYVVLPDAVLEADGVRRLRVAFERLRGWDGLGFRNDFNDRDRPYRRAADQAISRELDHAVTELFLDHTPFIRPFLCKYPGEDSYFEPHRDWMYTDERAGASTFVLFVALEDIGPRNGSLEMLPHSHRLDSMLRGTYLWAPWLDHRDAITERMSSISISAGHGVIWNHAVVHGSRPNLTPRPRLAAALWVAPRSTPLVHYRRHDRKSAARFDLDRDFFLREHPYSLMVAPPARPFTAPIPVGGDDWEAATLLERLDALALPAA